MPWLRTDDGPRKLRAVWLGPSGSTLPFQWTYVQWAVTLCAIPVGIALLWLVMAALGIPVSWIWPFAVPWGGTFAVYLAVKVMARVTFDEPLRYHQRLVRNEWSSLSRRQRSSPVHVSWQQPTIGYLSPNTLAVMGWTGPAQIPLPQSAQATPKGDLEDADPVPEKETSSARPRWQQQYVSTTS